jgi:hypothetical protein
VVGVENFEGLDKKIGVHLINLLCHSITAE